MTENINIYGQIHCTIRNVSIPKQRRPYIFESLYYASTPLVANWEEAVEWAEIFNSFCRNFLTTDSSFEVGACKFQLHVESIPLLEMGIQRKDSAAKPFFYFSKYECAVIYSKMSKILNKCDLLDGQRYETLA